MAGATHVRRIFSGVQPTGNLHLGNYLGAVKNFVNLQSEDCDTIYCIVDLHAITTWQEPRQLIDATRELTATFVACGLNPNKSILFNQSQVPAHTELGWIFNCVARMGWMNRMTQFKDKAGKNRENASIGLFAYPALMAADILSYQATEVPVGEDQKQHLELTRDIATKFNNDFGVSDFFPLPEPILEKVATRVMSLRDGTKKMSKSDPSNMSRIDLTDDADTISKKIRKAKTDQNPLPETIKELHDRPEALNLINIYASLIGLEPQNVLQEFNGKLFNTFKPILTDLLINELEPISRRIIDLMKDKEQIDQILYSGATRAKEISEPILEKTYEIIGLLKPKIL